MIWVMSLLTFAGGVLSAIQSGSNATLSKGLHQPLFVAFIIALANCVLYIAAAPFVGLHLPDLKDAARIPWWAWFGGVFGACNILTTIYFAGRLGSGVFVGLVVTAGIISSIVLDHFGLAGFDRHPAGLWRITGCLLMLGGLGLVAAF